MTPHLRTESDKKANNIMKKNDMEQTRENISPARRNTPARRKILNALEEELTGRDLDDIQISELVKAAGVSRKTFYRHFMDKYDLVNQYFSGFFHDTFEQITFGADWDSALLRYLEVCECKSDILRHAYSSRDANCLHQYDIDLTRGTYEKYLRAKGADIDTGEMRFAVEIASPGRHGYGDRMADRRHERRKNHTDRSFEAYASSGYPDLSGIKFLKYGKETRNSETKR